MPRCFFADDAATLPLAAPDVFFAADDAAAMPLRCLFFQPPLYGHVCFTPAARATLPRYVVYCRRSRHACCCRCFLMLFCYAAALRYADAIFADAAAVTLR